MSLSSVQNLNSLPQIARSGVGVAKVSVWDVGTPERQRETIEAISKVWGSREWPDEGLLSYSVYIGEDGKSLLHYTQWADEATHAAFLRAGRAARFDEVDAAVPGIERLGLYTYELYRSTPLGQVAGRVPGCVVIVDVEFEEPDPARQRDWVDTVFEALDGGTSHALKAMGEDPHPHPGGISGHFHVSTDGTRVLNYAEWESADAHIEALAGPGDGVGSPTPQWTKVRTYPGVTGGGVKRYTPALSFSAGV
ncbi:antibiotic biosynthesis monooxygenase [Streptomyces sp. ISL-98]|uniref:antibiotic biosynthesis monooxygenase n=1 Tax=Streptomyces sp. ISL-98 TaxID=2819192 RepID=UPI001BEA45ED|nr:antibiotic biosynthesis monooxygenase [Streptomyces sp. ISL-98]MBT2504412.1 antibiotic biosynthesis monooxygenase [Streptomyces sp. ISL-98]